MNQMGLGWRTAAFCLAISLTPAAAAFADAPCVANFSRTGTYFSGQKYRSFQEFPELDRYTAFDRVARLIASSGYQNVHTDKDLGTVTADGAASFSRKSFSVSAIVRRLGNTGASVEVVIYVPGGLTIKTQEIKDAFCRLLKAAGTSERESPGELDRPPPDASPAVEVLDPEAAELTVRTPVLRVRALAHSNTAPIATIEVRQNGALLATLRPGPTSAGDRRREIELEVTLQPGENLLTLRATDTENRSTTVERRVHLQPELIAVAGSPDRPNLILLAIGISDYSDPSLRLAYASSDARAVAELFAAQEGANFRRTFIKTLPAAGGRAGRAEILAALDWFRQQGSPRDVRILFLSGHGSLNAEGELYFLSQDQAAGGDPELEGVRWDRLVRSRVGSEKAVLFLDTCHSGRASGQDLTDAIQSATRREASLVVYSASTRTEASIERPEWGHGAFTHALLSGLRGEADGFGGGQKDGKVDTEELGAWLKRRVRDLTADRQHPTFDSGGRPPFDLVRVQ